MHRPPDDCTSAKPASFVTHSPYRQQTFNPSPPAASAWALLLVAKQAMKPFFWNLADWCVLAIIVWANDNNTATAERLLDAAGVWVGVVNALSLLHLASLIIYKDEFIKFQEKSNNWNICQVFNYWSVSIVTLIVFAWSGWVWSFGFRLVYLIHIEIIRHNNKN